MFLKFVHIVACVSTLLLFTIKYYSMYPYAQFSSVQLLSRIRLFATPWIAAHQASQSITNSQSSLKLMSIESVMPSSCLILCHSLVLLPPIPPSIRVFSNELTLRMRWPKYWSFSVSIIPSKEIPGLISLQSKGLSRVFSNTTVQKHQFFGAQPSWNLIIMWKVKWQLKTNLCSEWINLYLS